MYYILNETNQIIAADDNLLELCGATHIDELSSGIITNEIIFDFKSDEDLSIISLNGEENFRVTKTSLSSLLGHLTLVSFAIKTEVSDSLTSPIEDESLLTSSDEEKETSDTIGSLINEEEDLLGDSDIDILDHVAEENTLLDINEDPTETIDSKDEKITFGDHLSSDDNFMELKDEEESVELQKEENLENEALDDSELFDLISDETSDEINHTPIAENLVETPAFELSSEDDDISIEKKERVEVSEINIDIDVLSNKIGISTDDYSNFLNEFIDTALSLEKDLQSDNEKTKSDAINTLSQLSDVLHLPVVGNIITDIAKTNSENQRETIESFYNSLSRITTSTSSNEEASFTQEDYATEETPSITEEENIEEETLELFDEPVIQEEKEETIPKPSSTEGFGSISLEGIKPKHFDFQLEEAANDLSLPVELIEEFVHDFIEQSHIETKKMLEAYEKGDLDAIQKIGHLLKGASSNLRINPLSDTLYKIQFCEDSSNLDLLIKDYWAHFLSFENQINMISK